MMWLVAMAIERLKVVQKSSSQTNNVANKAYTYRRDSSTSLYRDAGFHDNLLQQFGFYGNLKLPLAYNGNLKKIAVTALSLQIF